jgi:hypothetical protein
MARFPRILPLSRLNGATPTRAAAWRRVREPSSGSSARSVRALTSPTPGTERNSASLARQTALSRITPLELVLDLGQGLLEPAEVGVDPLAQGGVGGLAPVPLRHEHLEQLPPACHQGAQVAGRLVRQGTRRRPDRLGEAGDRLRVEAIGLGQPPHGAREGADLARVDHRDRQAGRGQGRREADLQPAGGLEHDQRWRERDQTGDQRRHALVVVVDGEALAGGAQVDVEPALGDVDADEGGSLVHDPGSLDAGCRALVTVRVAGTRPAGRRAMFCLGLGGPGRGGLPPAYPTLVP